jgi:hypothetical protein
LGIFSAFKLNRKFRSFLVTANLTATSLRAGYS